MWSFISDRRSQILLNAWNHAYLVILAVIIATVIAVAIAVLVTRVRPLEPFVNFLGVVDLTIPSFALVGLLIPLTKLGSTTALVAVCFYAVIPIMRNAIVGLNQIDANLTESARGMGMGAGAVLFKVRLPMAWPIILAGIRVSTQMSMGIAAIAAYVLGPGLGGYIFTGLTQLGGLNGVHYALVGTVAILLIALIVDLLLVALGRLTTSKGIRTA